MNSRRWEDESAHYGRPRPNSVRHRGLEWIRTSGDGHVPARASWAPGESWQLRGPCCLHSVHPLTLNGGGVCLFCCGAVARPCFGMERRRWRRREEIIGACDAFLFGGPPSLQLSAYYCVPATIRQACDPFLFLYVAEAELERSIRTSAAAIGQSGARSQSVRAGARATSAHGQHEQEPCG